MAPSDVFPSTTDKGCPPQVVCRAATCEVSTTAVRMLWRGDANGTAEEWIVAQVHTLIHFKVIHVLSSAYQDLIGNLLLTLFQNE